MFLLLFSGNRYAADDQVMLLALICKRYFLIEGIV
jgi:hypothetical protein